MASIGVLQGGNRSGATAAALLAGAVGVLALPSAVLAFSNRFEPQFAPQQARPGSEGFVPASVDPLLARSISVRALARSPAFRFTPAGNSTRPDRAITVAVRLAPGLRGGDSALALGIAPTAYSLGVARGYKGFTSSLAQNAEIRRLEMPDLSTFRPGASRPTDDGRFSPHIALDEKEKTGRAPRTFDGESDQLVDVGGSYRLTRNLNVTAGVRYSKERDRLMPLTDGRQDSQAVYVGTQFRF